MVFLSVPFIIILPKVTYLTMDILKCIKGHIPITSEMKDLKGQKRHVIFCLKICKFREQQFLRKTFTTTSSTLNGKPDSITSQKDVFLRRRNVVAFESSFQYDEIKLKVLHPLAK